MADVVDLTSVSLFALARRLRGVSNPEEPAFGVAEPERRATRCSSCGVLYHGRHVQCAPVQIQIVSKRRAA